MDAGKTARLLRAFGHENGTKSVKGNYRKLCQAWRKESYFYASENWNRPKLEVDTLMKIKSLKKELCKKNKIRLNAMSNLSKMPEKAQTELLDVIKNKDNTHMTLTLALSYGLRGIKCSKNISDKVKK
jgi:undecaprenyl diphosphate synthase